MSGRRSATSWRRVPRATIKSFEGILANGNSGFGVDNPLAKVHVGDSAIIATNLTVGGLSYIKLPSTAQTNGLGSGILYNDAGTIKVMP